MAYTPWQAGMRTTAENLDAISSTGVAFTPVWTGLSALGAATSRGRYYRVGRTIELLFELEWGTGATLGTGFPLFSLPVAAAALPGNTQWQGTGNYRAGAGGLWRLLAPVVNGGASQGLLFGVRTSDLGLVEPSTAGYVWNAAGHTFRGSIRYEAAS